MRKTIYAKMTALPVGLCALAFAVTSCGSSEYKKFADNEGKQVASILRETTVWPATLKMRLCHFTVIYR